MSKPSSILEMGMIYTLHEIKNPLTSIILTLESLESGEAESTEVLYAIIKKNAMEIKKSIGELCACYEEKLNDNKELVDAFQNKLGESR